MRESLGESAHVVGEWTVGAEELDVGTIDADLTSLALLDIFCAVKGSEAPLLGDDDLLATWELVLRSAKGLDGGGAVYSTDVSVFHEGVRDRNQTYESHECGWRGESGQC